MQKSTEVLSQKNTILSICIPTYNHAEPLVNALNAMIPQARPFNIPIYVSDNASTDCTLDVLKEFQKTYPFLFFQSNKKNLGIDQNMIIAARMATSKYVWVTGARRILLPGILEKIMRILEQSDWDMVVLNDLNYTFNVPKTQEYHTAARVLRELLRNLTGLGFQILPTQAWYADYLPRFEKTEWTIVGLTLNYIACKENLNVFFLAEPCATDSGYSHWRPKHFPIWTYMKEIIAELPETYPAEDREIALKNIANVMFIPEYSPIDLMFRSTLVDLRIKGIYNAEVFEKYREDFVHYGNFPPSVAYSLARFPIPVLKLYFNMYDAVRVIARRFVHRPGPLNPHAKKIGPTA